MWIKSSLLTKVGRYILFIIVVKLNRSNIATFSFLVPRVKGQFGQSCPYENK